MIKKWMEENKMLKKMYNLLLNTNYRYSKWFLAFQSLFKHTGFEEVFNKVMNFIKMSNIKGDYLEFGTYTGNSFITAYHFSKLRGLDMKYYAFDSFEGLPDLKGIDKDLKSITTCQFSCSEDNFKRILKKRKVNLDEVRTIKGFYDKVLTKNLKKELGIKKAAVIYIDCDLYYSTKDVFNFITSYIQDGTIIMFDDWFCFRGNPNRGEQRAFKEWLGENPQFIATEFYKIPISGNSFIINLRKQEQNENSK